MRFFIHHDQKGNILSVSKVESMDASLEHPYAELAPGESVLEVEPTAELKKIECHTISERYLVDLKR